MSGVPTDLTIISLGTAAMAFGGLALWLGTDLRRHGGGLPLKVFFAAVLATALWALSGALAAVADLAPLAAAAQAFDLLRYALWAAFVLSLLHGRDRELTQDALAWLRPASAAVVAAASLALVFAWTGLLPAPWSDKLLLLTSMALPVLGLVLVEQLFRNTPQDSRWGIKPLCLGLAIGFGFDLYLYSEAALFGDFNAVAFGIRGAAHAMTMPLALLASVRLGRWRSRLQVSHRAGFYSATLLLAGGYLVVVSGIGYWVRDFGGQWGQALQIIMLVAALAVLIALALSSALRARLRVFLGKNFFAYRYDYREQWLRFTSALSANAVSSQAVGATAGASVVRALADLVDSLGGSLWLKSADDSEFEEVAHCGLSAVAVREPAGSAFVRFLSQSQWIIDVGEAREQPLRYQGLTLPAWADDATRAWAIVPLQVGQALTGFVVLAPPRAPVVLDWEVRDLLRTASRQAAVFLAQIQATEALLEARKFDAFNRMSAFVVHDLKNIVAQLSLMMKNAQRLRDNPEFQQDMLLTVEHALEKMRQLMLQLREGARPSGSTAGVALRPILGRLAEQARRQGRELELRQLDDVSTRGDDERIARVLGHLVHNAFDATPESGQVWLRLSRQSGSAVVEVGDTGHGMTREFVETRLFRPFASTKAAGMGIGSYESSQYIRELGGRLDVESEPGAGTVITIRLPLFDTRTGSDLRSATIP